MGIISVIIVLGVLITVHEFGHLIIAKLSGVIVEKFSVGFGPALFRKKFGETIYQLSLIPLGGYIKMFGEEEDIPGGFLAQPARRKIGVVMAGPFSNFLLGIFLMFALYSIFGLKFLSPRITVQTGSLAEKSGLLTGDLVLKINNDSVTSFEHLTKLLSQWAVADTPGLAILKVRRNYDEFPVNLSKSNQVAVFIESLGIEPFVPPIVDRVKKGSPAQKIGIKPGDEIVQVGEKVITQWDEFVEIVQESPGKRLLIKWRHPYSDSLLSDTVIPSLMTDELTSKAIGQIGIWVRLKKKQLSIPVAFYEAVKRSGILVVQTFVVLYKVIIGEISRKAIGGPLMVAKITYEGAAWGWEYFLALFALLSINLAVVNSFPIPVLDGGRCFLFIIEKIIGRRFSKKELSIALNIGWLMIFLLLGFVLANDILRFIKR